MRHAHGEDLPGLFGTPGSQQCERRQGFVVRLVALPHHEQHRQHLGESALLQADAPDAQGGQPAEVHRSAFPQLGHRRPQGLFRLVETPLGHREHGTAQPGDRERALELVRTGDLVRAHQAPLHLRRVVAAGGRPGRDVGAHPGVLGAVLGVGHLGEFPVELQVDGGFEFAVDLAQQRGEGQAQQPGFACAPGEFHGPARHGHGPGIGVVERVRQLVEQQAPLPVGQLLVLQQSPEFLDGLRVGLRVRSDAPGRRFGPGGVGGGQQVGPAFRTGHPYGLFLRFSGGHHGPHPDPAVHQLTQQHHPQQSGVLVGERRRMVGEEAEGRVEEGLGVLRGVAAHRLLARQPGVVDRGTGIGGHDRSRPQQVVCRGGDVVGAQGDQAPAQAGVHPGQPQPREVALQRVAYQGVGEADRARTRFGEQPGGDPRVQRVEELFGVRVGGVGEEGHRGLASGDGRPVRAGPGVAAARPGPPAGRARAPAARPRRPAGANSPAGRRGCLRRVRPGPPRRGRSCRPRRAAAAPSPGRPTARPVPAVRASRRRAVPGPRSDRPHRCGTSRRAALVRRAVARRRAGTARRSPGRPGAGRPARSRAAGAGPCHGASRAAPCAGGSVRPDCRPAARSRRRRPEPGGERARRRTGRAARCAPGPAACRTRRGRVGRRRSRGSAPTRPASPVRAVDRRRPPGGSTCRCRPHR